MNFHTHCDYYTYYGKPLMADVTLDVKQPKLVVELERKWDRVDIDVKSDVDNVVRTESVPTEASSEALKSAYSLWTQISTLLTDAGVDMTGIAPSDWNHFPRRGRDTVLEEIYELASYRVYDYATDFQIELALEDIASEYGVQLTWEEESQGVSAIRDCFERMEDEDEYDEYEDEYDEDEEW